MSSTTVESLLDRVRSIPKGTERFDLLVPESLTLRGRSVPRDIAMAVVVDAVLGAGFEPAGFTEEAGGRRYRYEAIPRR